MSMEENEVTNTTPTAPNAPAPYIDSPQTVAAQALATSGSQVPPPAPDPRFVIERIGQIPYSPGGGPYSGCKMMRFESEYDATTRCTKFAEEAFNEFFEAHQNLMVVTEPGILANGNLIIVMVTNTLTDDQLEIVNARA